MRKNVGLIIFCISLSILSFNVGAASTIPASGVVYGATTVQSTLDSLITKTNTGDATAAQILSGKKALVQGSTVTGTMTNNGAISKTGLTAGSSYTIPAGYHNGSGKVTAATLASQTIADATAGDIASGKTAYVNGEKITGTLTQSSGQVGIVFTSSPVDMTQYTDRWAELTDADFKAGAAKVYGYVWANEEGNGTTSFTSTQTFKYNATTGKLSWSNVTKSSCISDGYLCVEASAKNSFVVWLGTVGGV